MSSNNSSKRGTQKKFEKKEWIALGSLIIILLATVIALILNTKIENKEKTETLIEEKIEIQNGMEKINRLRYWSVVLVKWHNLGHLRTMDRVFERLQYEFVNASNGDDWDFLWSIEQPFVKSSSEDQTLFANITEKKLRIEQKVNHFPGIAALVSKSFMNDVNADLPYILPSFVMPKDLNRLNEFIKKHPNTKLVEKNLFNRGVQIIPREEVLEEESEYFYQQFMDDHFLIDGHAFDFGVFVLITSFNPLRVYRYDHDVLFRFCKKPYHPFDPNDFDRYVVRRGCHNAYDMTSFEKTHRKYGFPFIKIFEKIIKDKGHDVDKFWSKIDDAIVKIVKNTESYVMKGLEKWNMSSHHSFELVRFDFLIDNKMNPYVMEVNMSPNLTPAHKRYEENSNLYEPMVYNAVQMIGGASYFEFMARFNSSDIIVAQRKNIAVGFERCLLNDCHRNCSLNECKICLPCVDEYNRYQMREAFREHTYTNNFRRLFPTNLHYYDQKLIDSMTENNQISINCLSNENESQPSGRHENLPRNDFQYENFDLKSKKTLRYWSVSVRQWNPNGSLRTMNRVFEKLGYKFVNASNGDKWDILWSIEYPFKSTIRRRTDLFKPMVNFKPTLDQRVNHFPGIQFITNKRFLAAFTNTKYLLPTFVFPDDENKFNEYSSKNPDAKYVEKNYNNRGVRIVASEEFDKYNEEKIYQAFMDNPFLIDGHAFDFGVYVLISSVNPLRIYRYDHEVFIRFCPEKYHPFDHLNTRKYVVDDEHMSVYEMPLFREIYAQYGYTFKLIFENFIESAGFDVKSFWMKVDDAISSIILQNEKHILEKITKEGLNSSINFFELVRFDMILDEDLNPYVLEINMSPNLTPAGDRFEENILIYEPLVYNTLKLISAGSYDDFKSRFNDEIISSNFKNLATNFKGCTENECIKNCNESSCMACLPCVEKKFIFHLFEAYREHVRKGEFKRIFPSVYHFYDNKVFDTLNDYNKKMLKWYKAKCENDNNWC